jgi:DNA polymerase IV
MRQIIHLTIAAFPVAVERVIHPELRGRPVVIAPPGSARSVVIALSSEAREAGVRTGMILSKAMKYCRNAIVLPPNEPLYIRASRAIHRVLEGFSPLLEPSGYGHAYLDITGTIRLFGPARDTAWNAQKEIRRQVRLEASLGVASNKMVSKIASEIIRPSGLQDVPHGDETSFLSPLPVRLLPGVGFQTERLLEELNLRIIHDIAVMRLEHLALAFGRLGFSLHQHALGIDSTPVRPVCAIPAVDREKTLAEDSNEYDLLKRVLFDICDDAGKELRQRRQCAGRMELRIRFADSQERGRSLKMTPSQSSAVLYGRALPVLNLILNRRTRVRSVHLHLTHLSAGSVQMELFADPGLERHLKLESALDQLHRRFGAAIVASRSVNAQMPFRSADGR